MSNEQGSSSGDQESDERTRLVVWQIVLRLEKANFKGAGIPVDMCRREITLQGGKLTSVHFRSGVDDY